MTITNFHDIRNLSMRVEAGQSLHISGKSGCGKSGIFEAILWCFYGVTRGVEPRSNATACVTVKVEFDDGTVITRAKNKKLLRFESSEESVEGDLAQVKINDYFQCDRECWIATSYVIQEKMHFIFTLPAADRYNMLLRLSMHGEDAEKRMKKLSERIRSTNAEYTTRTAEYQRTLAEYEALCEKYGVGFECALSVEKTLNLTNQAAGYSSTLQDLSTELDEAKSHQLRRETHLQSQARIQRDHAKVITYSEKGLANLEELYKSQRKVKKLSEERDELQRELNVVEKKFLETKPKRVLAIPSEEQLKEIQHQERRYQEELAKAKQLKVDYTKEDVLAEIEALEATLQAQEKATLVQLARDKSSRLQECITELPEEPPLSQARLVKSIDSLRVEEKQLKAELEIELKRSVESAREQLALKEACASADLKTRREQLIHESERKREDLKKAYTARNETFVARIEELHKQLRTLERSREVHSCPYCDGAIRYVNEKIEKSEDQPFDEGKFHGLHNELTRLNEEYSASTLKEKKEINALGLELEKALRNAEREAEGEKVLLREEHQKKIKIWERNLKKEFGDRLLALDSEIEKARELTETWTKRLLLLEEISRLRSDLEALPEPIPGEVKKLTPAELEKTKSRLAALRGISFHEKPAISYEEYQLALAHKKHSARRLELTSKIAVLQSELTQLGEISDEPVTANALTKYREQLSVQKALTTELQRVEEDLAKIPETRPPGEIQQELKKYQRLKAKCDARLSNSKKACALIKRYDEIEALHNVCSALNMKLIEYERFSALIKEKIVDSITELIVFTNNYLEQVAALLFDAPISIELTTEKQFKSGTTRQEINLLIHYKGGQVYNYESGLSGGEKARINAMLTLAFARYIDSKILIFDEVVSFLDDKKAQQLMDIVHDPELGVPNRFILLASQNCSSGLVHTSREYDSFVL